MLNMQCNILLLDFQVTKICNACVFYVPMIMKWIWILKWVAPTGALSVGNTTVKTYLEKVSVASSDTYRTLFSFYLWLHSFHYSIRTLMYFLREVFLS